MSGRAREPPAGGHLLACEREVGESLVGERERPDVTAIRSQQSAKEQCEAGSEKATLANVAGGPHRRFPRIPRALRERRSERVAERECRVRVVRSDWRAPRAFQRQHERRAVSTGELHDVTGGGVYVFSMGSTSFVAG